MNSDVIEVRFDQKVQDEFLARSDRSVLMIKIAGVLGAIVIAVLALTPMMVGMTRWLLLAVAVIDLPVFLWYLPSVMNKPRRAMREVHSRGGVLFTMTRQGVVRPHRTAGDRQLPWSEVELERYTPEVQNSSQQQPTFLQARLGDEEVKVISTALSPSINEIIDGQQRLRG